MAPLSSTLAWRIPWMEEPGGLQSMGSLRVRHNWATSLSFSLSCVGEGHGNPLQCSCLENPRDKGAWWAAIYGVTQSRTRLKWLSSSSISLSIGFTLGVAISVVCGVQSPGLMGQNIILKSWYFLSRISVTFHSCYLVYPTRVVSTIVNINS